MKWLEFKEGVGRITKQNQTVDVGPNEISIQAKKFGNSVDKDGRPTSMPKKTKGSKTNVLFNLGLSESVDNDPDSVLYFEHMKETLGEIAQATEIYVDMDGVLADFFGEWAKLMQVDHFTKIDKEHDINDALQAIRDKDKFWLELPLLPQAKQLLGLIKQVKGEYNICSSPLADDPKSEPHKRKWIEQNLSFFPPKNVYITHNKAQFAKKEDGTPNILIDDFGKNVNQWEAAGGIGFKYKDHKFERTAKALQQQIANEYIIHEGRDADLYHVTDDAGVVGILSSGSIKPKLIYTDMDRGAGEEVDIGPRISLTRDFDFDLGEFKIIIDQRKLAQTHKITPFTPEEMRGEVDNEAEEYVQKPIPIDYIKAIHLEFEDDATDELKDLAKKAEIPLVTGDKRTPEIIENFADGKKKGKSRPGRVKRAGASCNGSVTALRKKAKNASGERAKMYHWCANMKSGRKKK